MLDKFVHLVMPFEWKAKIVDDLTLGNGDHIERHPARHAPVYHPGQFGLTPITVESAHEKELNTHAHNPAGQENRGEGPSEGSALSRKNRHHQARYRRQCDQEQWPSVTRLLQGNEPDDRRSSQTQGHESPFRPA